MRVFLLSAMAFLTACGSADETARFDASRADKWNGVYRLENVSTLSTTVHSESPTGNCQITLRHVEGIKYEQTVEFDCRVGIIPIVKRSQKFVNIDDSGSLTLIDTTTDAGTSVMISPTYYTLTNNQQTNNQTNIMIMRFAKQ